MHVRCHESSIITSKPGGEIIPFSGQFLSNELRSCSQKDFVLHMYPAQLRNFDKGALWIALQTGLFALVYA